MFCICSFLICIVRPAQNRHAFSVKLKHECEISAGSLHSTTVESLYQSTRTIYRSIPIHSCVCTRLKSLHVQAFTSIHTRVYNYTQFKSLYVQAFTSFIRSCDQGSLSVGRKILVTLTMAERLVHPLGADHRFISGKTQCFF